MCDDLVSIKDGDTFWPGIRDIHCDVTSNACGRWENNALYAFSYPNARKLLRCDVLVRPQTIDD